jgi:hypothetical protein
MAQILSRVHLVNGRTMTPYWQLRQRHRPAAVGRSRRYASISATHQRTNAIWRSKRRNKPRLHEFDAVDAFEASHRECLGAHPHQLHIKRRRQAVLLKHPIQAKQTRSENVAVQVRV